MRGVGLDFLSNAAYVRHERLPVPEAVAPGGVAQRLTRDNTVRIACERRENFALFHGERYALAVWANRFCVREVKRARCELKRIGLGGIAATKHGAYAQHELLRRKGLWNVVVGACAQSRESIFGLVFRRKEHHGQRRACGKRPQVFAQRKAVAIGQHDIEQRKLRVCFAEYGKRLHDRSCLRNRAKPLSAKHVHNHAAKLRFVVNHQNALVS